MIIQPFAFELMFYLVILLSGLDLTLSGFQVFWKNTEPLKKPKLLGLLIIRAMHISDTSQKQNRLTLLMFAPKSMGFYTFFAGVLLIVTSSIMIFDILLQ